MMYHFLTSASASASASAVVTKISCPLFVVTKISCSLFCGMHCTVHSVSQTKHTTAQPTSGVVTKISCPFCGMYCTAQYTVCHKQNTPRRCHENFLFIILWYALHCTAQSTPVRNKQTTPLHNKITHNFFSLNKQNDLYRVQIDNVSTWTESEK